LPTMRAKRSPYHSPWFGHANNFRWRVYTNYNIKIKTNYNIKSMKLFTVQLPSSSGHFIPVRSKYSRKAPCSERPLMDCFLKVWGRASQPYKTTGKIMVLYILTFTLFYGRRGDIVAVSSRN
jgi:hypothetical protein